MRSPKEESKVYIIVTWTTCYFFCVILSVPVIAGCYLISFLRHVVHSFVHSHKHHSEVISNKPKTTTTSEKKLSRYINIYWPPVMCIQIVERYAACRCIYYKHAVDPCPSYGRRGHEIRTKEVSVGYKCSRHSVKRAEPSTQHYEFPDSGYASGSGSRTQSSGYRR